LEDTAFYRFYPLASLNEVGGEPNRFGVTVEQFHARNAERQCHWPHTLAATSTHDTKRSEDVRARINVLSEMPAEWARAIARWREMNRRHKVEIDGAEAPDANEEYLLYQTLVGAWPLRRPPDEAGREEFVSRIQEYMNKALKEAKVHTSWISPHEEYDEAVREFVRSILKPCDDNRFLPDFVEFQGATARAGLFNSLSQTLVKIASPGVPDIYQGTEIWNFSLVDPDNRRPVDYEHLAALLASLDAADTEQSRAALIADLLREPEDGRLKLYVTSRALGFRRRKGELFRSGDYLPLAAVGERAGNVVAFARRHGAGDECVVVAARFFTRLMREGDASLTPLGADVWGETAVLPERQLAGGLYRDVFTGGEFDFREGQPLPLARLLAGLPLALLERV
jgi:(1->4)-alpha-D-glucan 1-alpha-D-glucosylmutase